jgi:hypothetical protein
MYPIPSSSQSLELWNPPEQLLSAKAVYVDFNRQYDTAAHSNAEIEWRKKQIDQFKTKLAKSLTKDCRKRTWCWELTDDRARADIIVDLLVRGRKSRGVRTQGVVVRSVEETDIFFKDWQVRLLLPDGKLIRERSDSCDTTGCAVMPCCLDDWELVRGDLRWLGTSLSEAAGRQNKR